MADNQSNSRLFTPPMSTVPAEDAMVERVPLDRMDHAARKSQTGKGWDNGGMAVRHIPNNR